MAIGKKTRIKRLNDGTLPPKGKVDIAISGDTRRHSSSFYRGEHANFMPKRNEFAKPTGISEFILKGWMPYEPFISPETNVVAFGSCFAANIGRFLASIGYDVPTQPPVPMRRAPLSL